MEKKLYLILHNIRSSYNVGAIFRSSDGAGVAKIYLTGYTPSPYHASKETYPTKAQKMISKTALGAEKFIPWEKKKNINLILDKLKKEGVNILALEQSKKSVDVYKFRPNFPSVLILGNEVKGMDRKILKKADVILEIPMRGKKESLNVSVAAGIAVYQILK